MKSKTIFFITLLTFVFNFLGSAQMNKADKLFETYNYSKAIPLYLKVVENNGQENPEAMLKLAECYRLTNNVEETCKWYKKIIETGNPEPVNYYYLGQALKSLERYDEAAEAFKKYSEIEPDHLDGAKQAQYCKEIKSWLENPELAELKNVESLNSKYSEFCPVAFKRGIVFTSDRERDPLDKTKSGWTNTNYLDLYYAEPGYEGKYWSWVEELPKRMDQNFNQSYHDGPIAFSSDFKQVYVTKTAAGNGAKNSSNAYMLEIFYAQISDGGDFSYEPFFLNSSRYSVAHPTLSADNKTIIFSSDMPGGIGGSDLYYCKWENNKWTNPINLGDKINTVGNEVFPYLANDSVLFFSSNGLMGFGGLDVFQASLVGEVWTNPENLLKPINSSFDDFGVIFSEDLEEGLVSSNRPEGKGADDIYAFRKIKSVREKIVIPVKQSLLAGNQAESKAVIKTDSKLNLTVSGQVQDGNSRNPLDLATVFIYAPFSGDVHVLKTDAKGHFEILLDHGQAYICKAVKSGFVHHCVNFNTPLDKEIKSFKIQSELTLSKLEAGQISTVRNIYYDLGKWYIRQDAQRPLDSLVRIMKQYPIVAELSSHTDSRGSQSYNLELSQKRAEAAVRYIILQGIHPARISAKGFGENKLVNHCSDGVNCTDKQHEENRRTEFKITTIDGLFFGNYSFNPEIFNNGDLVNINVLGYNFFEDCSDQKPGVINQSSAQNTEVKKEEKEKTQPLAEPEDKKAEENKILVQNTKEDNSKINGPRYRIQLIALTKAVEPKSYFSDIEDLIGKYGVSVEEIDSFYKYQLGNFLSKADAQKVVKELKSREYRCFIVAVDNGND